MPAPLSVDLRERIVAAYRADEGGFAKLAERFAVGEASVNRLVQLERRQGSVIPKAHGGGPDHLIPTDRLDEFKDLVHDHADATLPELAELCSQRFGKPLSPSCVVRACKRAKITRKKRR